MRFVAVLVLLTAMTAFVTMAVAIAFSVMTVFVPMVVLRFLVTAFSILMRVAILGVLSLVIAGLRLKNEALFLRQRRSAVPKRPPERFRLFFMQAPHRQYVMAAFRSFEGSGRSVQPLDTRPGVDHGLQ